MTEKIKEIIANQLGIDVDKIEDDAAIIDDLGADSLDVVEMLLSIEETLGVTVPDEDAANLKSVQDIVDYIEQNQ
jgi:acyl carrier protein